MTAKIYDIETGLEMDLKTKTPSNHLYNSIERIRSRLPLIKNVLVVYEQEDGRIGLDMSIMDGMTALAMSSWLARRMEEAFDELARPETYLVLNDDYFGDDEDGLGD